MQLARLLWDTLRAVQTFQCRVAFATITNKINGYIIPIDI